MPFQQGYAYGQTTQQVTHQAVPADGRKVVSADYAILYIGNVAVGLVQRFSPRETRGVMPQYEIGNIYPVEFVPSVWTGEIEVQRLEIFKDSLFDAFSFNQGISTYDLANYWPSNKTGPQQGFTNGGGAGVVGPIVTTIADIQWPVNLEIHITNPRPESNQITVKTYLECWITGWQQSYDAGAKVVASNVTFMYRNVQVSQAQIVQSLSQGAV